MSMVIYLPNKVISLDKLAETIPYKNLQRHLSNVIFYRVLSCIVQPVSKQVLVENISYETKFDLRENETVD